jgi:uncharacterized membrane protein
MVPGRRRRIPFAFVPAAALTGAVFGHLLAYLTVFPRAASRQAVLSQTGHSYWTTAEAIAVVCGLATVLGTVARHFGRGMRDEPPSSAWAHYRSSAVRLAAWQVGVFVSQETLERLHAGAPLSGLLHDGFIAVGILMQILVAAVLALILTLLGFTAEAIGRALARPKVDRRATRSFAWPNRVLARERFAAATYRTRAPPLRVLLTV